MDQSTHTKINWLSRQEVVDILESHGLACYDSESTDDLRDCLRENIMDGEVALWEVE